MKLWSSGTKNVQAWECVRQSSALILGAKRSQLPQARELLDQALNLDPDYAIARVMLGCYHQNFVDIAGGTGILENADKSLAEMKVCAEKAIRDFCAYNSRSQKRGVLPGFLIFYN